MPSRTSHISLRHQLGRCYGWAVGRGLGLDVVTDAWVCTERRLQREGA